MAASRRTPGTRRSAFSTALSDFTGDITVADAITFSLKMRFRTSARALLLRYQGTFLRMSNFTASASATATITAQLSSESKGPLLEGVFVDLSVDIEISPPSDDEASDDEVSNIRA